MSHIDFAVNMVRQDKRGMKHTKKPWVSKLRPELAPKVVPNPRGPGRILVPTPLLVAEEIRTVPVGSTVTPSEIRISLAQRFGVDSTCPMTTGIFINILAGAAEEELANGKPVTAPYWRVVQENGVLSNKIPPGPAMQAKHLKAEGHSVEQISGLWRLLATR